MSLKLKIILMTVIPLVVISYVIGWITINQSQSLGVKEISTFRESMLTTKEQALEDYVHLAIQSIDYLYDDTSRNESELKHQALEVLRQLRYGNDGYFFVYDEAGFNLAHPIMPELEGQNLINLKDSNGNFLIQNLLASAKAGGGFHQYLWHKPSTNEVVPKLSYAIWLPKWKWMVGTGLYIEDIGEQIEGVKQDVQTSINHTYIAILVILVSSVLIMVVIALAVNLHEHRIADERLRELAFRNVMLQEDEKKYISRELHDCVNQLLVSAKCHIELLSKELHQNGNTTAGEHLQKGETSLIKAIKEVRNISRNLRPSALDDIGLNAALELLASDFATSQNIQIDTHLDDFDDKLLPEVTTTLYRVVQESLVNIEKHSQCRNVDIILSKLGERLQLIIRDDGKGFNVSEALKGRGIGLRNMRERIEFIGGDFEISAEKERGTEVSILLELSTIIMERNHG
ncbi:cache domain-containing protein [Grimontia sp. SpTr1]|uniref:cache domain-containing protein n=1 Tax=Grimontia sp. SpTr1 TaxID=2995319 RepID=UPI00248B090B|nr:cache domain-containing protein [Grimontia sp. SpTr1]